MTAPVFWRNRTGRRVLIQALFVAALIGIVATGILTERANLARQASTPASTFCGNRPDGS